MNDDRIFYGPHPCATCGKLIVRASHQQGGEAFDQPDGPIYPNTQWQRHACTGSWSEIEDGAKFIGGATPLPPTTQAGAE